MLYRLLHIFSILTIVLLPVFGEVPLETHIVKDIVINIDGKTKISALQAVIMLEENDSFSSGNALFLAAERERRRLVNHRVFHYVTMSLDVIDEKNGIVEWRVIYNLQDALTLFPIGYPKYGSNNGLRLGLKTYYYNAFGNMTDMYLGLGLNYSLNTSTGQWAIKKWDINPRWNNIRIGSLRTSLGYLQSYEEKQFDGDDSQGEFHYGYYHSNISIGTAIPIVKSQLHYNFSVSFDMKYGYNNFLDTSHYTEERLSFGWHHSFSYGQIDWRKNFRQGQNLTLGHSISPVLNPEINRYYVINTLSLTGSFYRPFGRIFNYYSRAGAFVAFNSQSADIASDLRGIADDSMNGDWGFYLNNAVAIQFWRLAGVWDAQVHPFLDIGFVSPFGDVDLNSDVRFGAGLDFVLYLDVIPNFLARGMIAVDLGRYDWNDLRKYEFTIESSLQY